MPYPATPTVIVGYTMVMPVGVIRSRDVSCSRATQINITTSNTASQCALKFISTAGTQTESAVDSAWAGAFLERLPTLQGGADSIMVAPEEQQGNHNSSCSSYSGNKRKTVNDHETIQIEGELCAVQSCQQPKHQKSNFTIHEKGDTDATPHTCTVCKKHFRKKGTLLNHMRLHTGKPYLCSVCQKGFALKCHLASHEKSHTFRKLHMCSVCLKIFARRQHLLVHQRLHTGKKPYACSICQKSFTQQGHLVSHERLHTGEKPYVCSVCQKSFSRKGLLGKHKRSHTGEKPYACIVCRKSFFQKVHLINHERSHTGERPYVCIFCQKSFTQKVHLVKHEKRLHTGQEPEMNSI